MVAMRGIHLQHKSAFKHERHIPFDVVYGHPSPTFLSFIPGTTHVDFVEQELLESDTLLRQVRLKLSHAKNIMKQIYDKSHK
jgi:hypothetical protein